MTTDHDPQTVPATGPLPAWLAEQLDLEQRRQQIALPAIERHLRNLHEGKITLAEFEQYISSAIAFARDRVDP